MSLLIDGYNLLNAVGITGRGTGASSLERSRLALLNFLADSLDAAEIPLTTIIFDASHAPPGLPRAGEHRGLKIRFAPRDTDADTLLEELIRAETSPRRLTVVSSDHRLQRAARRRRARAVDSDVWYGEIVRRRSSRTSSAPQLPAKPAVPLLEEEVERWLRQFGGESLFDQIVKEQLELDEAEEEAADATKEKPSADEVAAGKPVKERKLGRVANPFPPGYGEDLQRDNDLDDPFPQGFGEDAKP